MTADRRRLRQRLRGLRDSPRGADHAARILPSIDAEVERSVARRQARAAAVPVPTFSDDLPVCQRRADIAKAIADHQVVVICGETGSGKTTQLPKICLNLGRGIAGLIGHTQPRRIAARAVAHRIASELTSTIGHTVGFKVRFSDRTSPDGYIKLMTDGILLAETQQDRWLEQYDTLIIDEAHERSLNIDFLIGYLRQLLPRRPDLKVIITSATIDPQRFSRHFDDAPIIEVSGRMYPVEVRYRPVASDDPDLDDLTHEEAVIRAVDEAARTGPGDVLVFLPGEREIRETAEALRKHHVPESGGGKGHVEVVPLYARLSADEQMKVFAPHAGRRIVLATNIAETSLTVPGIRYVIDTGVARISRYSARSRVQRLPIEPISRASADQRKGRCGRVSSGVCFRLYSETDFLSRPEFTDPEILRTNLASVILQMTALQLGAIEDFPFVERPDERMVKDGYDTLVELGAIDDRARLTPTGRELARLPIDPRIGRMILAAEHERCLPEVLIIASALACQDPRERPHDQQDQADAAHERFAHPESDFLTFLNIWIWYQGRAAELSTSKLRKACKDNFISYLRMREWSDTHHQLRHMLTDLGKRGASAAPAATTPQEHIHRALLAGLLNNVGAKADAYSYQGVHGGRFAIFPGSVLFKAGPKWIMAAELVRTAKLYARTVAPIRASWVEQIGSHLVKRTYTDPHWNTEAAQVRAFERVSLHTLELAAGRRVNYGPINPVLAREMFIHHALVEGNFRTKAEFVAHNLRLIDDVRALEAKRRRRDILVETRAIFDFYDRTLPADICSGVDFERWRRAAEQREPGLLRLALTDLIQPGKDGFDASDYPDAIDMNGALLPLEYAFEPGQETDGVTLVVPTESVHLIEPDRIPWLVRGLLREKVIALIRALPKDLRTRFGPAPDAAEKALRALDFAEGSLFAQLSDELGRIYGVPIEPHQWTEAGLERHLRMNIRVLDAEQRTVVESRDLGEVRRVVLKRAGEALDRLPRSAFNRDGLTDWDFDELPERMPVRAGGIVVDGHPAIVPLPRGAVGLRILASPQAAEARTREGLRRLLAMRLKSDLRFRADDLEGFSALAMQWSTLNRPDDLREQLMELVAARVYLPDNAIVRTRDAFTQRLDEGWNRLAQATAEVARLVPQIIGEHSRLAQKLESNLPTAWRESVEDVQRQLRWLTPASYLASTPWEALREMPRYLLAARKRLEKLPGIGPMRDAELGAQAALYWGWYETRREQHATQGIVDPNLERFRWMVEEFRVSLFAQELGTSIPVSPRRLERAWESVKR